MANKRETITRIALLLGLLVLLAGCGGGRGDDDEAGGTTAAAGTGGGDLSGRIQADGSSTVGPYTTAAAEKFQSQEPNVQITVGVSGTGGGFERFCRGETDLSNASRPIDEEEATICTDGGIEPVEFQVANDALTIVVNKDNDWVDCLTTAQLKKIWEPSSKVKSWKDVDPSFPDEPLSLFGPGTDSGTFDYFTDEINGEEGASRSDYAASEDDNNTVTGVSGEKGGLGYFGFSYFEENQDTLKAVEVDGGDGCVAPSVENAQNGTYKPLSRPLFVYVKKESLSRPEVEAFLQVHPRQRAGDRRGVAVRAAHRRAADEGRDGPRRRHRGLVATPEITAGAEPRLRAQRRRFGEDVVKGLLFVCALISVATTVGIVIALFIPAFEFFQEVSIVDFLTGTTWAPLFEPAHFGVLPLIGGTLLVTLIASIVAMPLGVGAAIYLSEYASPRARGILKPALETLAGIPTIVFGYFALTFMTALLRDIGIEVDIFNTLSAGLVMGVMLMPIVASLSEDAMGAVPRDLRDGAYALGSTKVQVATRIVVPAAVSGIVASFVLAISRAVGETMIVLVAMGQQPNLTFDPREAAEAMTAFIAATGAGDVPTGSIEYKTIFAVGATLFVMTLVMNVFAIRLVRKYREVYE